jgi:hypothetical protein
LADHDIEWERHEALKGPRHTYRGVKYGSVLVLLVALLYYPAGMLMVHDIDDDLAYQPPAAYIGAEGSRAVAVAAGLIEREVEVNRWVANDPIFMPGALLDNMRYFQQGIIAALARFAFELTDRIGRTRGSSQVDSGLQEAAGLLQYSGTKWVFDFSTSLAPTATSEAQYRKAKNALVSYNARIGAKDAVFDPRADNLLATLDRMASDLGSASAVLDRRIAEGSGLIDAKADNVFYTIKGQTYAYYLLLRELEADFDVVVRDRDLTAAWQQLLISMASAAQLNAWVITNGEPGSLIVPNHLAEQGFYLLRARTQLREITDILLK